LLFVQGLEARAGRAVDLPVGVLGFSAWCGLSGFSASVEKVAPGAVGVLPQGMR